MGRFTERQRAVLMANPWFADIDAAAREDLLAGAHQQGVRRGASVYNQGDAYSGTYCVLDGSVRISSVAAGGRLSILTFYEPGAWFGEIAAFAGGPRSHAAHAHKETVLLHLPPAEFDAVLGRHPGLCRRYLQLECRRLRQTAAALDQFSTQTLEQRLAARLLMLADSHGTATSQGLHIELHLSQETVAHLIGATRQRVQQLLAAWSRDGLVAQRRGRLVILKPAVLEALVAG